MVRRRRKHDPKLEALVEQGALHTCPSQVRDTLFQSDEFFDPRDLVQVRYEMLRRVRVEGCSITETAALFGLSRQSFYKIQDDMEREGIAWLLPRKRGPRHARKLKDDVMAVISAEIEKDPQISSRELARRLVELRGIHVHPRSIERALTRQEKKRRTAQRRVTRRSRPRPRT